MTRVTAIVVSYNSRPHLPACLTSVVKQEVATEIIVVDNASTDSSAAMVRNMFPTVQLIVNADNRGFATAVNQGLALATGEFVLLLNPDAVLLPAALAQLVDFLETHPYVAAAGPRQWLDTDCTWQWSIVPSAPHWRLLLFDFPGLRRLGLARRQLAAHWALNRAIWREKQHQATPYLSGACLLLRRMAVEAVGRLDEGYFLFFEDIDLCVRLRAAGWGLYAVPTAGVVHAGLSSARYLPGGGQSHLLSSGSRYLARHGDPLTRALWALLRILRSRYARRTTEYATPDTQCEVSTLTLRWPPLPAAAAYWVELAPDSTFLYAIAAQVVEPACMVPSELLMLPQGKRFFWRVAAVDTKGQLGSFTPTRCQRGDDLPFDQNI